MRGLFDKKAKRMAETAFGGNVSLNAIGSYCLYQVIFRHFLLPLHFALLCKYTPLNMAV